MSSEGLDRLVQAAACEGQPPAPLPALPPPPAGLPLGAAGGAAEIRVLEVDAFASVQDLIHAAILANKGAASLKEIYEVCQSNGRIAYKRAGGSRLITANDHWKSQIRHALYTGDRFQRVAANQDLWQLVAAHATATPQLVKVLVRADEGGPRGGPICAAVAVPPSATGAIERDVTAVAAPPARGRGGGGGGGAKRARSSRKRSSSELLEEEDEDAAADADEEVVFLRQQAQRSQRGRRRPPAARRLQQEEEEEEEEAAAEEMEQQQQAGGGYGGPPSLLQAQHSLAVPPPAAPPSRQRGREAQQVQQQQFQQQQQQVQQQQFQPHQQLLQEQQPRGRHQPPLHPFAEEESVEEAAGEACDSAAGPVRASPALHTPPMRRLMPPPAVRGSAGAAHAGTPLAESGSDPGPHADGTPLAGRPAGPQQQQPGRLLLPAATPRRTGPFGSANLRPGAAGGASAPSPAGVGCSLRRRFDAAAAAGPAAAAAAAGGSPGAGSPVVGDRFSAHSDDPSNLRWGSTGLRSSIIIASPDSLLHQAHSSLSAGRTPLAARVARPLARGRAPSAEAESPAAYHHAHAAAAAAAAAAMGADDEGPGGESCPFSCKPVPPLGHLAAPMMLTPRRPDSYAAAVAAAAAAAAAAASPMQMGHWERAMKQYQEQAAVAAASMAQQQQQQQQPAEAAAGTGSKAAASVAPAAGLGAGTAGTAGAAAAAANPQQQMMAAAAAAWAPLMFSPAAAAAAAAASGMPFGAAMGPCVAPMVPFMQAHMAQMQAMMQAGAAAVAAAGGMVPPQIACPSTAAAQAAPAAEAKQGAAGGEAQAAVDGKEAPSGGKADA